MSPAQDDWRLTIELDPDGDAPDLVESMRELAVEEDARERLGERVAVSADGPRIFLYADTEGAAREAERIVRDLLAERRLEPRGVALDRWHPAEERWEDGAVPLPSTPADEAAEHERLEAAEAAEARATGHAAWEVRVTLASHRDTTELADSLEAEGMPVLRRWRHVLIGAENEDAARALAERVRAEAPAKASIEVELTGEAIWRVAPANPFAVFGGMGG
jgi:hypothetical protein